MTMLIASMDHSPVESLGKPDEWHTSALLLSVAGDQFAWATTLGNTLNRQSGRLLRWSKARPAYRSSFVRQFPALLEEQPIFALAISAPAKSIAACFSELAAQLGLDQFYEVADGWATFGPTASGDNVTLPLNEAMPIIFLSHFLMRMHQTVLGIVRRDDPQVSWCDWQISPDNFQHGPDGRMAKLFNLVANSASMLRLINGNLRVLTFTAGDPGNDIADNLAGALRSQLNRPASAELLSSMSPQIGRLYWEQWSSIPRESAESLPLQ